MPRYLNGSITLQALANTNCPDFSKAIPKMRIENVHEDAGISEDHPLDQLPGIDGTEGEVLGLEHKTDADSPLFGMVVEKSMSYRLENSAGARFTALIAAGIRWGIDYAVGWFTEICFTFE